MKLKKVNTRLVRFVLNAQQRCFDQMAEREYDRKARDDNDCNKAQFEGRAETYMEAARQMFVLSSLFED